MSIRSKFNWILKVGSYEVETIEYSRVLSASDIELETDYLKVSKVIQNMLRENTASHIVSNVTTGVQVKLLIKAYSAGYVTLLSTKGFNVFPFYKKKNI